MIERVGNNYATLATLVTAAAVAACGSPKAKSASNGSSAGSAAGSAGAVTISVSSIHLAEDCGEIASTPPVNPTAVSPTSPPPPGVIARPERRAQPSDSVRMDESEPQCDQSALQLQLVAAATPSATVIAIRKIELLDETGKVLGELTPRSPTQWMPSGQYTAWDQSIAGGATIKASYALSAPSWPAYGLTRASAAQQTFRLRVTVTANGSEQVVSGQATVVSPPTPMNTAVPT
jgi:hypothetical protein